MVRIFSDTVKVKNNILHIEVNIELSRCVSGCAPVRAKKEAESTPVVHGRREGREKRSLRQAFATGGERRSDVEFF
jgi:hypothetical protein